MRNLYRITSWKTPTWKNMKAIWDNTKTDYKDIGYGDGRRMKLVQRIATSGYSDIELN
jgi:hypothetical protein